MLLRGLCRTPPRRSWALVLIGGMLVASAASGMTAAAQQKTATARQLLQHAAHLEEVVGDLDGAVAAYEAALEAPDADVPLAATAKYRLAALLARLGRKAEALAHYRQITELYARDSRTEQVVRRARTALGDTARPGRDSSMVARRLWEGSERTGYGSLAPDGSFVSFVDWTSSNWNLAVRDLDSGKQRFLTHGDTGVESQTWASSSVVAANGRQIAYAWHSPERGHTVHVIDRDGSGDRAIVEVGTELEHLELESWSGDGEAILAIVYAARGNRMVLMFPASGEVRTIVDLGSHAVERASLSPDGRWVAYDDVPDGVSTHDIRLAATDGSLIRTLVDHPADDLLPVWTPDGKHLLFVSDRSGTLGAWIVEVTDGKAGSAAQIVKPDFGRSMPMRFTDDGSFVYAVELSRSDIYTAKLDLGEGKLAERVASSGRFVGVNNSPVWSVDGNSLAYVAERGSLPSGYGPRTVVVRDLVTGAERLLTPALHEILQPRWHPDGQSLLVLGIDDDHRQAIFRVDANSGAVEPFATWDDLDCRCVPTHAISADATQLAYFRPQGVERRGELVVRDLGDDSERILAGALTAADVGALEFSPDGSLLAAALRRYGGADGWILEVLPLNGKPPRALASLGSDGTAMGIVGWSQEGRNVLFVRANPSAHSLAWVGVDGHNAKTLIRELPYDLHDLRLHPDGVTLVYTSGGYRAEIWMLENLLVGLDNNR